MSEIRALLGKDDGKRKPGGKGGQKIPIKSENRGFKRKDDD